jgi:protein involved in sex pheromone biosynthesis
MGKHVFYSLADDHVMSLIRVAQEHYEEEGQLYTEAGQLLDMKGTERGVGEGEGDDTRA